VIFDAEGNLYGDTNQGGMQKCKDIEGYPLGCGTVFELSPADGGWTESILYNFTVNQDNYPAWPLTMGPNHMLYGTTPAYVFRLAPPSIAGEAWSYKTLYQFPGLTLLTDSGVTFDAHGNLYGTGAGLSSESSAFEISPPAQAGSPWTETRLGFVGYGYALGGLIRGPFGALYGATLGNEITNYGSVFAIVQ